MEAVFGAFLKGTALTSIRFQVKLKIRNIYVGQVSRLWSHFFGDTYVSFLIGMHFHMHIVLILFGG